MILVKQVRKPRIKNVIVTLGRFKSTWSAHQLAHQKSAWPEGNELSGR